MVTVRVETADYPLKINRTRDDIGLEEKLLNYEAVTGGRTDSPD